MFNKLMRSCLQWSMRHKILATLFSALTVSISSCAFLIRDRVVSWEEEVLLNTGETIIVQRTVPWVFNGGGAVNPSDFSMRASRALQLLEFTYKGKSYRYSAAGAGIYWIAIAPNGEPNLIAPADEWGWASLNKYRCTVPFYVQFKPNADGKTWTWPKSIEPWLYGLPYNLMSHVPDWDGKRKKRYTATDRTELDRTFANERHDAARIDPTRKGICAGIVQVD